MKFCILTVVLAIVANGCLGSMDAELEKLESELEKLELQKAKKELTNNIEEYLHSATHVKKEKDTKPIADDKKVKKSTELKPKEVTVDDLDDIVKNYHEKEAKRDAEESLRKDLEAILDSELKKRSSVPIQKCEDKRKDCAILKKTKTCQGKYTSIMKENCEKTCGHCNECYDKLQSRCAYFKKLGLCDKLVKKMEKYCYKTCGHCKMPAPPPCAKTTLGCCWDRKTTKIDKAGSNCPACADKYKTLCKTFNDDCDHTKAAGKFMRLFCPDTCGLCNGNACSDQPDQAKYCSFWKGQGLCEKDQRAMRLFCKKTCNLC